MFGAAGGDLGPALLSVTWTFVALGVVVVSMRIGVRLVRLRTKLQIHDCLMLAALVSDQGSTEEPAGADFGSCVSLSTQSSSLLLVGQGSDDMSLLSHPPK